MTSLLELHNTISELPRPQFAQKILCALLDQLDRGEDMVSRLQLEKAISDGKHESNLSRVVQKLSEAGLIVIYYQSPDGEFTTQMTRRYPSFYQLQSPVLEAYKRKKGR